MIYREFHKCEDEEKKSRRILAFLNWSKLTHMNRDSCDIFNQGAILKRFSAWEFQFPRAKTLKI